MWSSNDSNVILNCSLSVSSRGSYDATEDQKNSFISQTCQAFSDSKYEELEHRTGRDSNSFYGNLNFLSPHAFIHDTNEDPKNRSIPCSNQSSAGKKKEVLVDRVLTTLSHPKDNLKPLLLDSPTYDANENSTNHCISNTCHTNFDKKNQVLEDLSSKNLSRHSPYSCVYNSNEKSKKVFNPHATQRSSSSHEIECFTSSEDNSTSPDYTSHSPLSSNYDSDKDPEYCPGSSESEFALDIPSKKLLRSIKFSQSTEEPSVDPDSVFSSVAREEICQTGNETLTNSNYNVTKPKRIREKDLCFYCDNMVLNFARHLERSHSIETSVQEFMSKPSNSKERKDLIAAIRRKGNFILNSSDECVKPVRKANLKDSEHKHLPCIYCLGFFAKKQLWRHKKKCSKNPGNTSFSLTDAQTFLLRHIEFDARLKNDVFPHMAANQRSFVAKNDRLISAYGARYLKTHKGKHHIAVCSRKMQELARLLIEIKKIEPNIKNLIDALKPQHYDIIVQATKNAASYDEENDSYRSPTYAVNIGKPIKDCCEIGMTFALKKKFFSTSTGIYEDLKTTIQLIQSNWQYDVSSQAASNLNMNRWNKVTIVPLASDIKTLKTYLSRKGLAAASKLRGDNEDENSYRELLETVFCKVILLNRKRPGELERMRLSTYENAEVRNSYEEFSDSITPAEKILMTKFKRVVIQGKRNRGVPVLFGNDVQEHIALLINLRPNFFKDILNPFLFGRPRYATPICGYKVLEKHAKACGALNPAALTATRLRKHLATITQLFDMTEGDIEQLATFMGHTDKTHRGEYRLPDDVYQTAKICKLLLMMESGDAAKYRGKSLNEIQIDMDDNLLTSSDHEGNKLGEFDDLSDLDDEHNKSDSIITQDDVVDRDHQRMKSKKRSLVPWTTEQKVIVKNFFKEHIKDKRPPKKKECEALKQMHQGILKNKSWLKIKVFIQNLYTKKIKL